MREELEKACEVWAKETIEMIRQILIDKDVNASGSLSDSLREDININEASLIIWAKEHAIWVDKGRGPTKNTGDGSLLEAIKEWVIRKPATVNPYYLTKRIHEEGTLAHIKGINRGVFDDIKFWENRLMKLEDSIRFLYINEINKATSQLVKL